MFTQKQKNNESLALPLAVYYGLFGVICVVASVIFYVVSVNMLATKGYDMRSVENRLTELEEIHKTMKIEEAQLTSLYRVRRVSALFELEQVDAVEVVYGIDQFVLR